MAKVYRQDTELQALLEEANGWIDSAVIPAVADDIKRLVPVDTGELRDSVVPVDGGIEIRAAHAGFVEFGTEHMAAQPYVRPAVYRYRSAGEFQ